VIAEENNDTNIVHVVS